MTYKVTSESNLADGSTFVGAMPESKAYLLYAVRLVYTDKIVYHIIGLDCLPNPMTIDESEELEEIMRFLRYRLVDWRREDQRSGT